MQHGVSPKRHKHLHVVNIFVHKIRGQDVFTNLSRLASPVGYLIGRGVLCVLRAMSFVKQ